jgi:Leucine-rich repeat (LRR) protein
MSENKKLAIYAKKVDTDEVFEIGTLERATDQLENLKLTWLRIISLPVDLSKFWRLVKVDLSYNGLTYLPNLVCLPNLKTLVVNNNKLPVLPELPERLTDLNCSYNQLERLPDLPSGLVFLSCGFNRLVELPKLPATLSELSCRNNQLETLPKFPPSLMMMSCEFNRLKQLPVFNDLLIEARCSHNELTRIPYTNPALMSLKCSNNRIISIQRHENLHYDGVVWLDFKNNPVCRVLQYYTRQKLDQPYKLKVIDTFNRTYYGGKLREFIFTRCFEPFVRRKYHPDRLRERLAQCDDDDEEAFQRALLTW